MDVTDAFNPTFRITANSSDITATIEKYFMSLSLTDATGTTSDMLEITLADTDWANPIEIPPKGAELELFLGYGSNVTSMGVYIRDEVELSGWPGEMVIRARAAVYDKTPEGKINLQSQKTRSWATGTKLGDMVAKIANEHGMQSVVSAELKSIVLPHISQSDESDLNLLIRISKKYDAVAKPSGGKIILAKRGESKSASGIQLQPVTITPDQCSRFRYVEQARETAGTVVAYYHAVKQAARHEVKVGTGEPVKRIKMYFQTQAMALAAATAELDKRQRHQQTVSFTTTGNTDLQAEGTVTMADWRPGVTGDWVATRVLHTLGRGGYSCEVELEQPNDMVIVTPATATSAAVVAPVAPPVVDFIKPTPQEIAAQQAIVDAAKAAFDAADAHVVALAQLTNQALANYKAYPSDQNKQEMLDAQTTMNGVLADENANEKPAYIAAKAKLDQMIADAQP